MGVCKGSPDLKSCQRIMPLETDYFITRAGACAIARQAVSSASLDLVRSANKIMPRERPKTIPMANRNIPTPLGVNL